MSTQITSSDRYYGPTPCSLANTLMVVGERWTFLILREALAGTTRFSEFRSTLGVTPEVLSTRLRTLVDAGVMERRPYREPGTRSREDYVLTTPGRRLGLALAALQQWGDEFAPAETASSFSVVTSSGRSASVGFIDDAGAPVAAKDVKLRRTATHPVAVAGKEASASTECSLG